MNKETENEASGTIKLLYITIDNVFHNAMKS